MNVCKSIYSEKRLAILSNSVGSSEDKGYLEAKMVEESIGMEVIRHLRKKPDVGEEILKHFTHVDKTEISADSIAIVGDRTLSDTVMGNSLGYLTIEVQPFDTSKENFMVKMMRKVEKYVIPRIAPQHTVNKEHKAIERLKERGLTLEEIIITEMK